jgi:hypothetical protein
MTALITKKCQYITYLLDDKDNINITVEISDTKQIQITYENVKKIND